jgi:hypothetical protein
MTRLFVLLFATAACAGCGDTRVATVTKERVTASCLTISRGASSGAGVALCRRPGQFFRTAFYSRDRRGSLRPIVIESPGKVGHWERGFLSPGGKTLLAQWSAECEVPVVFFVPVAGGTPRRIAGATVTSVAVGWLDDGRAIVEFPRAACGSGIERPGVYAISLDGTKRFLAPLRER